jgi:hypothetical protein
MRPLVSDGRLKVLAGVTTPDEIARSTQVDLDNQSSPEGQPEEEAASAV